jgi:hypothetical protein
MQTIKAHAVLDAWKLKYLHQVTRLGFAPVYRHSPRFIFIITPSHLTRRRDYLSYELGVRKREEGEEKI